jgi:hypothetical protein
MALCACVRREINVFSAQPFLVIAQPFFDFLWLRLLLRLWIGFCGFVLCLLRA